MNTPRAFDEDPALNVQKLRKAFPGTIAVNDVDLTVPSGSFYGLVGPNGAGKTTLISMITGLQKPDQVTVEVFGVNFWDEPIRGKELIGVLPDDLSMPEQLTGRELLTYMGLLRGLDEPTVRERVERLIDLLGLADAERTLILEYSRGMRTKIALATALLHHSRLLILDEPFEAIDPISASTIKSILRNYIESGGSILFSSHVMATVEQLCDSVAVINDGVVQAAGPIDEVRNGLTLEERFVQLAGGDVAETNGLQWFER